MALSFNESKIGGRWRVRLGKVEVVQEEGKEGEEK